MPQVHRRLAHFKDFDPKYRSSSPSNKLFVNNIALELQKRHSPQIVFALSEDPALKELPLVEALKQIVGTRQGTVRFVIGRKDEDSHVEQGIF